MFISEAEASAVLPYLPTVKKRDLKHIQPDTRDAVVELSETVTVQWIHAFLDEVYRADDFFRARQAKLINDFITLQDKYRIRNENYAEAPAVTRPSFTAGAEGENEEEVLVVINRARTMINDQRKVKQNKFGMSARHTINHPGENKELRIPKQIRYRCLEDLQAKMGKNLPSYIVPEMPEILANMRRKHIRDSGTTVDEFERMVNWKRVFASIWQEIRWLISYSKMNELALLTLMQKFAKNHFLIPDNTINTKLHQTINETSFKMEEGQMTKQLQILSKDLVTFYANCFCEGDAIQARV